MICTKCRHLNIEDSLFCENCGAPIEKILPKKESPPVPLSQQVSPGIIRGADGILRWAYEMDMWKNPTLVIKIWKVLLLAALVPALLLFFLTLGEGIAAALAIFIRVAALVAVIVTGLMLLAYALIALINGGKYCVVFEMDDMSVKHIQMQKQFNKNQVLGMITAAAGLVTGNIQSTAAGMLAGSKQSLLSTFSKVKTIVVQEKRDVIYVNESLSHNQVYANPADFAFISEHIITHCKNAKVSYK